ncbi:MFS transporter [Lacticaseibacillus daqingensis]|uniref:MFS transporter n=1 Tax=Lacticaseibacillus daqingensis TaxID=2486014 RepID=UPI000F78330B|nr:MFS transporter [Lacticaseibacillus daqingensis]
MTKRRGLIVLGLCLIGANLRLPITMMPPLLSALAQSGRLSQSAAGWLTSIPLVMFACASPFLGRLGTRFGNARVLLAATIMLVAGSYLRLLPSSVALLGGTVLIGLGIANGNVLLPALIKDEFPQRIALMTTLYTTMMGLVASLGTGTAGLLAQAGGPNLAMGGLGLFSIAAAGCWLFALPQMKTHHAMTRTQAPKIGRQSMAWLVMLFFGLQSILYYSLLTWLPTFWQTGGFSTVNAGTLATCFQLAGLPMSLITPSLAERRHGLAMIVGLVFGGFALGLVGLLLGPSSFGLNVLLAVLMGVASGAAFSVCIVFFQKKADTVAATAALSGMAQAGGYWLAAMGPVSCGLMVAHIGWLGLVWVWLGLSFVLGGCGWAILHGRMITTRK